MGKTALIAGATGLVGGHLLSILLESSEYDKLKVLTRRPLNRTDEKLIEITVSGVSELDNLKDSLKADDIYCCLGTTMKKAGSKEAFREIDYHYPLSLARLSKEMGAKHYLLISAMGANSQSGIFYNQIKGDVESAIEKVGFEFFTIFRPALILGDRSEKRVGESIGKFVLVFFNFLFVGPLKKYKAVEAKKIAGALAAFAQKGEGGKRIVESDEIQNY